MGFWQALIVATVPSVAAVITAMVAFRDLGLRRRLETSRRFLELFQLAHGRPDGGRVVGVGEQVATIHLIADFARQEKVVRNAAREGLKYFSSWRRPPLHGSDALTPTGECAPEADRLETTATMRDTKLGDDVHDLIAEAAEQALKRLGSLS